MYFISLPRKVVVSVLMVLQLIFLDSCAGSPQVDKKDQLPPERDIVLNVIEREEKIDSGLKMEDNVPFVELKFSLLSLEGPAEKFFNSILYDGKNTLQYTEDTLTEWREEYTSIWNDPDAKDSYWAYLCGAYYETHTYALYADILVVKRTKDSYTGGAHGDESTEYIILDLKELRRLILDDLIIAEKKDSLLPLLKKALSSVEDSERINIDAVFVSKNVFYDPKGIGFHWNKYEIASHAAGQFEVIVPYTELSDLLTDKGRSLFRN
jgi:hypothetical protein